MTVRLHTYPTRDVITLAIAGPLDFSAHGLFCEACEQGGLHKDVRYVIDMRETERVHDSGLGLLLMLHKRAGDKADIQIVNCPPEIRNVLAERELAGRFSIADA